VLGDSFLDAMLRSMQWRATPRLLGKACPSVRFGRGLGANEVSCCLMDAESAIGSELRRLNLAPLTEDQVACLSDPERVHEAAGMLEDLRDRCSVRLPLPSGESLGGPFSSLEAATEVATRLAGSHLVVAIDEMATDESRNTGVGNEFYITGFDGADAALALAEDAFIWSICCIEVSDVSAGRSSQP
jgi:hypothetical protein